METPPDLTPEQIYALILIGVGVVVAILAFTNTI